MAPWKAWLTAMVVMTKPNHRKKPEIMPALTPIGHAAARQVQQDAGQHPGHDEQGDEGDDIGHGIGPIPALRLSMSAAEMPARGHPLS